MAVKWGADLDAQLRKLHDTGASCSSIAKKMGRGFTRNSIIGRLYRLGLTGTRSATTVRLNSEIGAGRIKAPKTKAAVTKPAAAELVKPVVTAVANGRVYTSVAPKPLPPAKPVLPPSSKPRTLADLDRCMCRWPINDPGPGNGDQMLFCAAVTAASDVYCPEHRKLSANRRTPEKRTQNAESAARMRDAKRWAA